MPMFAVMVGQKHWCTRTSEEGETNVVLSKPGEQGAVILPFPNKNSAWAWASKRMDDEYGNKFRVVEFTETSADTVQQIGPAPEDKPKRKKKRKRKARAVSHA